MITLLLQVSNMIRINSSVSGIVGNSKAQEEAVDQACYQRQALPVVEIECMDKYQNNK